MVHKHCANRGALQLLPFLRKIGRLYLVSFVRVFKTVLIYTASLLYKKPRKGLRTLHVTYYTNTIYTHTQHHTFIHTHTYTQSHKKIQTVPMFPPVLVKIAMITIGPRSSVVTSLAQVSSWTLKSLEKSRIHGKKCYPLVLIQTGFKFKILAINWKFKVLIFYWDRHLIIVKKNSGP